MALKLHRQFGHPSAEKLVKLLRDAGNADGSIEEAIIDVSDSCVSCCKFKRPRPRPVVSLPMASKFNEMIAMDLKSYGNVYFLVLVDLATRLCLSCVITNKLPATMIRAIFVGWI